MGKMDLWSTPTVLVVHLKRFQLHRGRWIKSRKLVDFPITGFSPTEYMVNAEVEDPPVYDLFAITHHYGSLGGGHYVAMAQNSGDSEWYCFNDSSCDRLNSTDESSPPRPTSSSTSSA